MKNVHLLLLAFAIIAASSCKKKKPLPILSGYDFSYSAPLIDNYPIAFESSVKDAAKYSWDYGDEHTGTGASPMHVYASTGTYTVTLTLNDYPATAVQKQITISKNPVYTAAMGGPRTWHHTSQSVSSSGSQTYTYPDTTFAITVIDPLTILFGSDTMKYDPASSSSATLRFTISYNTYGWPQAHLNYDHGTGRLDYVKESHISSFSSWTNFYTP